VNKCKRGKGTLASFFVPAYASTIGRVVKLADTQRSGRCESNLVEVQVLSRPPNVREVVQVALRPCEMLPAFLIPQHKSRKHEETVHYSHP